MAVTRYTFTGVLELSGALHIGSGGAGRIGDTMAATDATVVRDSRGRPYIPGSSLRGALRAAISQLLPALFPDAKISRLHDEEELQKLKRDLDEATSQAQQKPGADFDVKIFQSNWLSLQLSSAERLFGTVYWSSPLLIRDLHLDGGQAPAGEIRHGVGIDRDTGAAREAIKYDFEVLPAGAEFAFWMRCDIPDQPRDYKSEWSRMLAVGLRLLELGELTLGGRAARGVGQVRLRDLDVYALDTGSRSALLDALLAGDDNQAARYGARLSNNWVLEQLREVR